MPRRKLGQAIPPSQIRSLVTQEPSHPFGIGMEILDIIRRLHPSGQVPIEAGAFSLAPQMQIGRRQRLSRLLGGGCRCISRGSAGGAKRSALSF